MSDNDAAVVYFAVEPPASKSDRDFSSANRYGTVKFAISEHNSPSRVPGQAMIEARRSLKGFREDIDYISCSGGDPVAMFVLGSVLKDMGVKRVKYLRYDRERSTDGRRTGAGFYTPTTIVLN